MQRVINVLVYSSLVIVVSLLGFTSFSHASGVYIDLRDSLSSWTRSTIDSGDIGQLPKSIMNGDIYEHAHALAEKQIAGPALEALDLTHREIGMRCDNDLKAGDVTNVFAATSYAQDLDTLMSSRSIIDDVESFPFDESCVAVVKCYFKDDLEKAGVDLDTYDNYSQTTFKACMDIVQGTFSNALLKTSTNEIMKNNNYGDEIFANGTLDDSPYDLLKTIEEIGDVLFTNNSEASKVRFYEMQNFAFFESNNPDDIVPQDPENYKDKDRQDRLPASSGVTPSTPDQVDGRYIPPQTPPKGWTQGGINQEGGGLDKPGGEMPSNGPINNELCEVPLPDREKDDDTLRQAEEEWKYTYERNDKLDLDNAVAVALGAQISDEVEELFGTDDGFSDADINFVQQEAAAIVAEIADLEGNSLQQFEDHVKGCIEQFTDQGTESWKKVLWKGITQPTLFSKCVFAGMCKEIGDSSGRGLYRIKICKQPTRSYGVTGNQPVSSVEEILDEMNNVCYGLRESGQLLKHNTTKDHREHKVMDVKLGEVFSFGLSVTFKPSESQQDAASEKRLQIENNEYLEEILLDMSDDLTFIQQRNKYNTLFNAELSKAFREESVLSEAQIKSEIFNNATDISQMQEKREKRSQLMHYPKMHSALIEFTDQNTEMRRFANEHTQSMLDSWKATYDEKFKKK